MEPLDLPKNTEEGGHSRRRISSILKAPRKSTVLCDVEQEENKVERAKPAEKRNSRRVSFAPANDVLLFAKDVKNASPARSPLQELMAATAAATPNWLQVAGTDDRSQQILGIENLLNAPLHASQQRNVVSFDGGEKTVMFDTEDAVMDLTQSHTINITGDADLLGDPSQQNVLITRGGAPEDELSHSANASQSASDTNRDSEPRLDLDFENFLASLSKPSSTGGDRMAALTRTTSEDTKRKTQAVDKENLVPGLLSSHRGAFCPEGDVNTDLTAARTERALGGGEEEEEEEDDPFQCMFPTRDMYARCDRRSSQAAEMKLKKRRKSSGSGDPKGSRSLVNLPVHAPAESQKETLVTEADHREKTVRFSTDDAFMDITRSHTVNIAADLKPQSVSFSLAPGETATALAADDATMDITQCLPTNITTNLASVASARKRDEICGPPGVRSSVGLCLNTGFDNLLTNPTINPAAAQMTPAAARPSEGFTICPDDDVSMDITEAQTGRILEGEVSMEVTEVQTDGVGDDHLQPRLTHHQSVNLKVNATDQDCGSSTCKEKSMKSSLKTAMWRHQFGAEDDSREKTVRFTAADASMDVTRSHTVNIIRDLQLHSFPILDLPANETKTVRFTAGDADMEVTRSHTVKISADLILASDQNVNLLTANGEKTVRFTMNDAAMDVTESHTVNISTDLNQLSQPNVSLVPANGERTVRFAANDADMDVTRSHTVNIATGLNVPSHQNMDLFPTNDEKTMRFTATDAGMDITRSHTVNISAGLNVSSDPNVSQLPANGEKTVRFTTNDADMDVTGSHTVSMAADLNVPAHQNTDSCPANGEKTMRFTATDAGMDMTRSHTVNISAGLNVLSDPNVSQLPARTIAADLKMPSHQDTGSFPAIRAEATRFASRSHAANTTGFEPEPNLNFGPFPLSTEKTVRPAANKAAMAARRSDTVDVSAGFEPKSRENVDFHPLPGDKTTRFTTNDASMEITHCFTVNIASDPASDLVLLDQNTQPTYENMNCPPAVKKTDCGDDGPHSGSSPSTQVEQEFKSSASQKRGSSASFKAEATDAPLLQETADSNGFQPETQKPETSAENEPPSFVSTVVEQPANETMSTCAEIGAGVNVTEPQVGCVKPAPTDESPHTFPSAQVYNSDHPEKTGLTSQNDEVLGFPAPDGVDSNKMETMTAHQPRRETSPSSQKMEPSDAGQDGTASSRAKRRKSLADLQSKLRRLSNIIKATPDAAAVGSSSAPLPQLDPDLDRNPNDKTTCSPVGLLTAENDTGAQSRPEEPANATPFSSKTQQLMSRLSVGGFKAKLPQRNNPESSKKLTSAEEATRNFTDSVTRRLRDFDDVDDVFDEELGSCEDMSETLDTRTPEKTAENENPSKEFYVFDPEEDDFFKEPFALPFLGQKGPPPEERDSKEDEKRLKASAEFEETAADGNVAAAHLTTQTIDSSTISHSGSRNEAASESTFKHSLFESQLEDYDSDGQKKLKDGTITVLEFFNLFNIDFVTHNPRQSALPGRLSSDADVTPLDLLKNRHIDRPKLKVYEADIQTLTETVEELKVRRQDLNKPLRAVNGSLWEEIRHFSDKELKSFRHKLKERNNIFRKTSKVQSHEMKEVLYSNLVRVNLEEQQKLRGTIQEADEMLKRLDGCIWGLEAEINAVSEKDSEDKKCLKTLQEEFRKITEVLADSDRQISELEMQKKQNSSKLSRMRVETKNLKSHINMLNMLNEWRLKEEEDSWTSYTFLHDTVLLQLVYEKPDGNAADSGSERKITNITFKFDLNDEKSQFHACLAHKLVSESIQGESAWVEKYPTSRHVPKLLHDVSLVVSPCRLLGEELRLLKMWGSLRFDILHISCAGTQVHVVFSSLKKMSKFEVVFGVRLSNQLCVFQVQSFKNTLGNTAMGQIEEIVASQTSDTKLTTIIKKIHESLLC
ncbi:uncharacterized protein knl1 [Kryptolebias marmoratus]|uniref:Kinetochore scaffold 1 n=1 Tax=Kryptolebias marmoratus TaxID=37003 RepID=A0A3Q3BJC3_KRYMA|nr:uncharacterized protein knl1 [Kryptolebias marmoratus]